MEVSSTRCSKSGKIHSQDDLINQEEDKNHVMWIIKLDDSRPAVVTERVVGMAKSMKGGGLVDTPIYIRAKYLKNDYI